MSASCNFDNECAYVFDLESQDQLENKQRRALERAKSLNRKRQEFERTRAAYSMPPRRGAPHRAARSATRTSLAGGVVEFGADIPVISVPDRQNLQRKKQPKKARVAPMLKPSLWPVQKPTQQANTMPTTSFAPSVKFEASAIPNPTVFWKSAEALPTCLDSIDEDALDTLIEEQLDCPEHEEKEQEQPNALEQQEESHVLERQQVLGQLMDELCAQNGGLEQKQVAAAQIQELFVDLEAELQALQKKSKAKRATQPLITSGKWPKLEDGPFQWLRPSNHPLQQQSEKVMQNVFEALGPVWQGAESLAKDAQSELTKTAAVVAGKPPSLKTWLEDPFASVSEKLEAASQKFEADASRLMDRFEAYTMPKTSFKPSTKFADHALSVHTETLEGKINPRPKRRSR